MVVIAVDNVSRRTGVNGMDMHITNVANINNKSAGWHIDGVTNNLSILCLVSKTTLQRYQSNSKSDSK